MILRNSRLSFNATQYFTQDYLNELGAIAYHLYILSDDKVKNGDYVCPVNYQGVWTFQKAPCPLPYWGNSKECQKVIATTDFSLKQFIPHMDCNGQGCDDCLNRLLPQPSQSFVDKYVAEYNKGNVITEVMVEYDELPNLWDEKKEFGECKLKVNPKDNTITIKKIKDSWTRDEVANLIRIFRSELLAEVLTGNVSGFTENWIENNLN